MPTFGDTTAGGDSFPLSDGRGLLSKFTLTEAGDVTQMNVRLTSVNGGAVSKALIYADSAGAPGALKAASASTALANGDQAFTVTVSLTAADYWLGLVSDGITSTEVVCDVVAAGLQRKEGVSYAAPDDPFGTPDASGDARLNVYATYTASGGLAVPVLTRQYRARGA